MNFLEKTRWAHVSISPRVELGGSKDCHVQNIIMYGNGKIDWLYGSMLPKIPIIWKNVSYKNCFLYINFLEKTQRAQMSIPLIVQLGGLKHCHVRNIIMYGNENEKIDWLQSSMLSKVVIHVKKFQMKVVISISYLRIKIEISISHKKLLKLFFHIIGIFGIVEPKSQFIFLFPYIIIFQTWQSFEPPAPLCGR